MCVHVNERDMSLERVMKEEEKRTTLTKFVLTQVKWKYFRKLVHITIVWNSEKIKRSTLKLFCLSLTHTHADTHTAPTNFHSQNSRLECLDLITWHFCFFKVPSSMSPFHCFPQLLITTSRKLFLSLYFM